MNFCKTGVAVLLNQLLVTFTLDAAFDVFFLLFQLINTIHLLIDLSNSQWCLNVPNSFCVSDCSQVSPAMRKFMFLSESQPEKHSKKKKNKQNKNKRLLKLKNLEG